MDSDLEATTHTSQDMSTLVLDNARFSGEATDDQDKQWYMHMHVDNSDKRVVQKETPTGGPASSSNIDPSPIPVNVQTDFAEFSSRSRVLGRMTSEQALEYFLDQHNNKCSESIKENETFNHSQNVKERILKRKMNCCK